MCYGRAWRSGLIQTRLPLIEIHSLSDIDIEARTATCAVCGPTAIRVRSNRSHECMTVRKRHRTTYGKYGKYGLTKGQYEALIHDHGGQCAICHSTTTLVIDHCHETGDVRGLLCHRCNVAIGWMMDDPAKLRAAADYLERDRRGRAA